MIVVFSDFGVAGPYTGQVNAVLQSAAPMVPVIHLFADAPAGQPKPSAYLLAAYGAWFPAGTVLLCVVDPGVGSARRGLIVEAEGRFYIGPDNGLFELVLRRATNPNTWEITWRPAMLSASFHGRDLFAPVAARLARGDLPATVGLPALPSAHADWPDDLPEIVYIDHYGNAISGLRGDCVGEKARLAAGNADSIPHAPTFSAAAEGAPFWYVNSNGLVEIAVNRGRAAERLGLAIGSPVSVVC